SGWTALATGTTRNFNATLFTRGSFFVVGQDESIFELGTPESGRFANLSARGVVDRDHPLSTGVVIAGNRPKRVLIRAIGPGLSAFGLRTVLSDPTLSVIDSSGRRIAINVGWSTGDSAALRQAAIDAGAFG